MTRLKLLFVTHIVSLGGASRSLRELLNAYDGVDVDLAVPRWIGAPDDAEIRRFFAPRRLGKIVRFWLPWSDVYVGHPKPWQSLRSAFVFPLAWRAQQRAFARYVERERYDAVHLNSLVLHPMVTSELPFILHVREILVEQHARVQRDARNARGTIFIDEATKQPFEPDLPAHHIVLNNPVDMTGVGTLPSGIESRLGADPARLTTFVIIGDLTDEKGVPFVVESFREVRSPDARLVVVGRGQPAMRAKLDKLAAGDRRIVQWGEERDVVPLFTLADYVLRGESYPCVGRTIYEALYAGCGVLVPGDRASHNMFEFDRFADRIHFYAPRDRSGFIAQLDALAGAKRTDKRGESNTQQYAAAFDRFVREAIGKA
ncbi:MAG TPA: glycosyltransferase [Kofleriaceae bacterium]